MTEFLESDIVHKSLISYHGCGIMIPTLFIKPINVTSLAEQAITWL